MTKKDSLRIAILGFGGRAQGLAGLALQSRPPIRVVCVADPRPERRRVAAEMFGADCLLLERGEQFYDQDLRVDGIWVISQECTHAQLAVPALERGLAAGLDRRRDLWRQDSQRDRA